MGFCARCGAYIPEGHIVCLSCGFDPAAELRAAAEIPTLLLLPEHTQTKPEPPATTPVQQKNKAGQKAKEQHPKQAAKQTGKPAGAAAAQTSKDAKRSRRHNPDRTMEQRKAFFADRIAFERKKRGLTQKEFGNRLRVSAKTVSKWEKGQRLPDQSQYERLRQFCSPDATESEAAEKLYKQLTGYQREQNRKRKKKRKEIWKEVWEYLWEVYLKTPVLILGIIAAVIGAVIGGYWIKHCVTYDFPTDGDYYRKGKTVYYFDRSRTREGEWEYEWWTWTKGDEDWELTYVFDEKKAPEELKKSIGKARASSFDKWLGCTVPPIYSSRAHKTVHFSEPHNFEDRYYLYQGDLYCYFRDVGDASCGKEDHSGWYRFDSAAGEWVFVGRHDDPETRATLGDFWYDYYHYHLEQTSKDLYTFFPDGVWTKATEFENTVWYREYTAYEEARDKADPGKNDEFLKAIGIVTETEESGGK